MSASPIARQAHSHAQIIPAKTVLITDESQLPDLYSSTPGGTLYSTTPGGTRIIYERAFLMNLRNSPLSRTPPTNPLPQVLMKGEPNTPLTHNHNYHHHHHYHRQNHKKSPLSKSPPISAIPDPEEQFDIDI